MNLHRLLQQRILDGGPPVRVGLIGAGKFGSMFLSQVPTTAGLEVPVIADLDPHRARLACDRVGWDAARIERTAFVASGNEACGHPDIDVVVEATWLAGSGHRARPCCRRRGQAHCDGECGGGCAGRTAPRGRGAVQGRRLFARLRRSAGAHLRVPGRLGARVRL